MSLVIWLLLAAMGATAAPSTNVYMDLSGEWKVSGSQIASGVLVLPLADDAKLPGDQAFVLEKTITLPDTGLNGLAVLIMPFERAYTLKINGMRIGEHGSPESLLSPDANPIVFALPDGALRPGQNQMVMEVSTARLVPIGQLSYPRDLPLLGPTAQLKMLAEGQISTRQLRRVYLVVNCGLQLLFAGILWAMSQGSRYRFPLRLMALFFLMQVVLFDAILAGFYFAGGSPTLLALSLPLYTFLATALLTETGVALAGISLPLTLRLVYYFLLSLFAVMGGFYSGPKMWVAVLVDAVLIWKAMQLGQPLARQYLTLLLGYDLVQAALLPPIQLPGLIMVGPLAMNVVPGYRIVIGLIFILMVVRQSARDRSERERLAGELEAARTIQQLLLPTSAIEGVDAFYQPAAEVGGDFYHAVELPEGSKLVVIGDVSGKGLRAAMLVSVCVGILRNEKSTSPGLILAALNEGLVGHAGGGFVTCSCARFDKDGMVTIANAGHPSPYCDGQELAIEAGLPLGIMPGLEYAEAVVRGDRFTFVSDGVVEAENSRRELFGFERTREISGKSAQEIAEAARAWGQTDDITVVTVRRVS
jgi:hypothetical protein